MTTVADLIADTQLHVHGTERQELNRLLAAANATQTSLTCEFDLRGITDRSIIAIDDELLFVFSMAGNVITVQRGYLGTTPAAHDVGALVEVNPRFPKPMIRKALRDEIRSWPTGLFAVRTEEFTRSGNQAGIDLAGLEGLLYVLDVQVAGSSTNTYGQWLGVPRWRLLRHTGAEYGSGVALMPEQVGNVALRVTAAVPFDLSAFDDDTDVADVGLTPSMTDIPSLGAASRLLAPREILRTKMEAQPQPRRAEEVPPGHTIQTSTALKRLRDIRISEEQIRLREIYPYRGF
jgi:hypothetical protein